MFISSEKDTGVLLLIEVNLHKLKYNFSEKDTGVLLLIDVNLHKLKYNFF